MQFQVAAHKKNLNYFGVVYGVTRDYHILSKDNEIQVLMEDWVDLSSCQINSQLLSICGPFSGNLSDTIKVGNGIYTESDRLATFVHHCASQSPYVGFGHQK